MTAWWLSWYSSVDAFELHTPWWRSGWRESDGADTIVAAVRAETKDAAMELVGAAYDEPTDPGSIEWRFCDPLTLPTPFTDRFPRAEWMAWTDDATCACPACR